MSLYRFRWSYLLACTLLLTSAAACSDDVPPDSSTSDTGRDTGLDSGLDLGSIDAIENDQGIDPVDDMGADIDLTPDVVEPDVVEPDVDAGTLDLVDADSEVDASDVGTDGDVAEQDGDLVDGGPSDLGPDTGDSGGGPDVTVDGDAGAEADLSDALVIGDAADEPDAAMPMPIFVDALALAGGDGASWASALNDLDAAVALAASEGRDVWVKAGTFTPASAGEPVLTLLPGVQVYGGFDARLTGTSGALDERSEGDRTFFDGDFDGTTENRSLHVVVGAPGARLDLANIRGGVATGDGDDAAGGGLFIDGADGMVVADVRISTSHAVGAAGQSAFGGGLYCRDSADVVFTNLIFSETTATGGAGVEGGDGAGTAWGGAAYFERCHGTMDPLRGEFGRATGGSGTDGAGGDAIGGCFALVDSELTLNNVDTEECVAIGGPGGDGVEDGETGAEGGEARGGGIYVARTAESPTPTELTWASVFSFLDSATGGPGGTGAPATAGAGCDDGGAGGPGGAALGAGIFIDGQLTLTVDLGKVEFGSAVAGPGGAGGEASDLCVAGPAGATGGAAGGGYFYGFVAPITLIVDFSGCTPDGLAGPLRWFVDPANEPGGAGVNWESAFPTLEDAISANEDSFREIWVREGTITPAAALTPVVTLPPRTIIHGGFASELTGLDGDLESRDPERRTVLDGDFDGGLENRSRHVVVGATGVRLTGLVISNGVADGDLAETDGFGGGLLLDGATDVYLANLRIENNSSLGATGVDARGGGLFCRDGHGLTMFEVEVVGNTAVGAAGTAPSHASGGGIYLERCDATVFGGAVEDNHATGGSGLPNGDLPVRGGDALGGGVFALDSVVSLRGDVSLAENEATGGSGSTGDSETATVAGGAGGDGLGGGLYVEGNRAIDWADILPWAILLGDNVATGGAGGDGNPSDGDPCFVGGAGGAGGDGLGGGVAFVGVFDIALGSSTIADNLAADGAGGIGGAAGDVCAGGSNGATGDDLGGGVYTDGVSVNSAGVTFQRNEPTHLDRAD